jgi:glycerol-3-phosphate dehydrogenase (NAD(P)+)
MSKLAVLGAGSWGIAVAVLLSGKGHEVTLWEFDANDADKLLSLREHPAKLPGIKIPSKVAITNDLSLAMHGCQGVVLALPSHTMRQSAKVISGLLTDQAQFIVSLAKGIENNTLCRMSEVLVQELPKKYINQISTLSGPSHAEEVSREIPTTVVTASYRPEVATLIQEAFTTNTFRVYTSDDLIGVELGGSLKNVIAIAAGVLQGLRLGDNTIGALMTRGLAEMVRLGRKLGADPLTFSGLSGVGDLITTCISKHSRNRYVGEQLGLGRKLPDILGSMAMVAEGVKTTKSAFELAKIHNVEMPITTQMYNILFEEKEPAKAVNDLMTRSLKPEIWA